MSGNVDTDSWAGGGYGKYPGLTMTEIRHRFDQCVADPSARSISAVLRITHEQIEARGRLGLNRAAAILSFLAALLLFVSSQLLPGDFGSLALKGSIGIAVFGVIFAIGAIRVRHALSANLAQERQIRQAALAALELILAAAPQLKPLTREQRDTLVETIRKEGYEGPATNLLNLR